jgi:Skp family chaperone for outer membrane proteins
MKTFRLIAANFIFAAVFAASAFAQAQDAGKIGLVNTLAFEDSKGGITKLVTASSSIEAEFKQPAAELETMYGRIQILQKEIQAINTQLGDPKTPAAIDKTKLQASAQTKADEGEKLARDFKFKQEDLKARLDRRRQAVVGPVYQDVMKALQEFAVKNGYAVILDGARLEEAQILMAFNNKYDVTKEFIAFYNARPAGTTAAAKP